MIEGLVPETTYYYRLIAENANGQNLFTHPGSLHTHSHSGFVASEYPGAVSSVAESLHMESIFFSRYCEAPAFGGEMAGPSQSLSAQGFEGESCGSYDFDMSDCELLFDPANAPKQGNRRAASKSGRRDAGR